MGYYKHFIRTNEAMIITHGFSSAFEQPIDGDNMIGENDIRHFNEFFPDPIINERGQFRFKWEGKMVTPRTTQELEEEWSNRPPSPPTDKERIEALEQAILAMMEAL